MLLADHMVYLFARALANRKLKAFLTGHKKWMTVSEGECPRSCRNRWSARVSL